MLSLKNYDVVIAGASFAGLAVASKIKSGKVLLVDRKPLGKNIKSACGTLLSFVGGLGFEDCVRQVHQKIVLHVSNSTLIYHLSPPFCVIDGEKFCQTLFKAGKAEFYKVTVLGFGGKVVKTSGGDFPAKILVEASGPKSGNHLSFGLETVVDHQEEGLHFWYEPKIFPKGIFWLFPQGKTSRVGVGSYRGTTNLLPLLEEFLRRFGLKRGVIHGGYFPHSLGKPVSKNVFLVGDAAGQCLPLTGEGIRPAIFFGQKCGEIIEKILQKKISLPSGLKEYQEFVLKRKIYYHLLDWTQDFLLGLPEKIFYLPAWLASKKPLTNFILRNYLSIVEERR